MTAKIASPVPSTATAPGGPAAVAAPGPHPVPPATMAGPLAGVVVIDLTRVLAGPYCTMVLADLGARVIKVEQPGTGDDSRAYGPFVNGASAYFASLNRGKQSIALDLKTAADRAIFDALLANADVVVENFRPGTMEKLGYGWETLHQRHPRLIYAAASGFGHSGPYSRRAAYDMVVQAMGGIMSITGHPGQPPVRVGTSIGDITAGLFTAIGVNAALLHRAVTGAAIKVDVAMLDCQVAILENAISRYAATGEVAGPIGARHPSISPFAGFEARDGWMVVAAGNDALFQKMCDTLGVPALAKDRRFLTNALRTENWEPLFAEINRALKAGTVDHWLARLDAAGVPCGPINAIDKVLADPHVRARNMVVTADDPDVGVLQMAGNPIKLSSFADPATRAPAPKLDQNRAAILGEFAPESLPAPPQESTTALVAAALPAAASAAVQASRSALRWIEHLRRAVGLDSAPIDSVPTGGAFIDRARALSDALLSERGEVLGTVIAHDLVRLIRSASSSELVEFLTMVATRYAPDPKRIATAAEAWRKDPSERRLAILAAAVEAPRQELFRRINMGPDGTATLVDLRTFALEQLAANPDLAPVDADLRHLFGSWFNRGFLELRRIDWHTPAAVLEKLIAHEAVHAIDGWDDLRRRLASDRRCFAFFHPALPDDPLIFIEVALVDRLSAKIEPIIRAAHPDDDDLAAATASTAVFYSISNCQPGLKGVSFGNFLIKQVAADLARELPALTTFSTLSPIPSLRTWIEDPATALERHLPRDLAARVLAETKAASLRDGIARLAATAEAEGYADATLLSDVLVRLAAHLVAGTGTEKGPRDPVARFHLGNGARIERINWMADLSRKGVRESYGLMVNYLYDLASIEANHEAFANRRPVATSRSVAELLDLGDVSARSRSLLEQVDAAIGLRTRKS